MYRRRAAQYRQEAELQREPGVREALVGIAKSYERLADEVEGKQPPTLLDCGFANRVSPSFTSAADRWANPRSSIAIIGKRRHSRDARRSPC